MNICKREGREEKENKERVREKRERGWEKREREIETNEGKKRESERNKREREWEKEGEREKYHSLIMIKLTMVIILENMIMVYLNSDKYANTMCIFLTGLKITISDVSITILLICNEKSADKMNIEMRVNKMKKIKKTKSIKIQNIINITAHYGY